MDRPGASQVSANSERASVIPEKAFFRIGEVSRITATKPFVLRYWETEFPMLQPVKSPKGHRLYRRQDIETVLRIKRLLYDEGFTIAGARRHLREQGSNGDDASAAASAPHDSSPAISRKVLLDLRDALRAFLTLLERR
jgi:DNA-binding transcriptional MerR regulator